MGERRLRDEDEEDLLDWDSPASSDEPASADVADDDPDLLDWDSPAEGEGDHWSGVDIGEAQILDRKAGEEPAPPPEDPRETERSYMDGLLAYGDGLLGHWGGEAAKAVTRGAEYLSPEGLTGMGEDDPQRAEQIVDRAAQQHPYANGAGQMTTGIAAGMVAGPGIAAQAAMGAGVAAGSEMGDSHDPLRAAGKGLVGGAVSGAAAGAGAVAGRLAGKPIPSPGPQWGVRPPQQLGLFESAPSDAARSELGAFGDQLVNAAQMFTKRSPTMRAVKAAGAVADRLMAPRATNEAARWSTINGAEGIGETMGAMYRDAKNRLFGGDDEDRAPATNKVVDWALKSVLTAPDTGLSQDDAAGLFQKMQSGDPSSLLYTLGQKYPAFKMKYEKALRRANGDNE